MVNVTVRSNKLEFGGWKVVNIQKSLDSLVGAFNLTVTDQWTIATNRNDKKKSFWALYPGDKIEILVDDKMFFTGYVDQLSSNIDATGRNISISGKEKTVDLVDCSETTDKNQFEDKSFLVIAKQVCDPFQIKALIDSGVNVGGKLKNITVNPGESFFQTLDKAARDRGLLITTNEDGNLLITKSGARVSKVGLVEGKNIKSISISVDHSNRFKTYKAYGQGADIKIESAPGSSWQSVSNNAVAIDKGITRKRTKMLSVSGSSENIDMQNRVRWEAKTRAARSETIVIETPSWTKPSDKINELWKVNEIVHVTAESSGIDGDYLIGTISYSQSYNGGESCTMTLIRPDAYLPEPVVEKEIDFDGDEDD